MATVLPSHIVNAIDSMFGANRNELDGRTINHTFRAKVHALLRMLDDVPPPLIDLNAQDYLEFCQCRGVLAVALSGWVVGDVFPVRDVGGRDPVERIRRLMIACRDFIPAPEPELPFIIDDDARNGLEDRIQAAWKDFHAGEWMGATVLAGHALEALLLWAVKQSGDGKPAKKPFDELFLQDLIREAEIRNLISRETRQQAELAKDARNLIHPGKASRSSSACSKSTAMTALAAVYRTAQDLKSSI